MEIYELMRTTLYPGRYFQGYDALPILGDEISRLGKKGFVICDPFVYEKLLPTFRQKMRESVDFRVEKLRGECSDEAISHLSQIARDAKCDVIVGLGGGKTLDTAKVVAHTLNTSVVIVPTIASTDAPCSALAVIYTPQGTFKRYSSLPRNPDVVLIDTKFVVNAPVRSLVAGMGNALSAWFETDSSHRKNAASMTGRVGSMTPYTMAILCYESLLKYGVVAKTACEIHAVTPALETIVETNTLLSGLGFKRSRLAAAHAIHNGLTALEQTRPFFRGEKVAMGTLTSLFLTDKPKSVIDEVYTFCNQVGLPITFADIGLAQASDDDLMKVAETACAPWETIHNEPMAVTPLMVFSALKAADAEGKRRKVL
jgi:glycerol dehydrogenase